MARAGFSRARRFVVERMRHHFIGKEVLEDPFLAKDSTSQLILLTGEAYAAGLARIQAAIESAERQGRRLDFPVDLSLMMVIGELEPA